MEPSLIIGLGTSGLKILEHIQDFLYVTYANHMRQHPGLDLNFSTWVNQKGIALLNIETCRSELPRQTPGGKVITSYHAGVKSLVDSWQELQDRDKNVDWFNPQIGVMLKRMGKGNVEDGAGNYRAVGRFAPWPTFQQSYRFLKSAYEEIIKVLPTGKRANIIVTGTLIGGTCSGMFVDMGYMARQISLNLPRMVGFFLMPPSDLPRGFHRNYANTWAALEDMDAFVGRAVDNRTDGVSGDSQRKARLNPEDEYIFRWPDKLPCNYRDDIPYDVIYLVSTEYAKHDQPALQNYNVLCYVSGYVLFTYICGLRSKVQSVDVDGSPGSIYASLGFSGVAYPIYGLGEYTACGLAMDLITAVTNEQTWTDAEGNSIPIQPGQIFEAAAAFLDGQILQIYGHFLSLGEKTLGARVADLARKWESGGLGENPEDTIRGEFRRDPQRPANLAALMGGQKANAENALRKSLGEKLEEVFRLTENLKYLELFLEGLEQHRARLLKLWKDQGIDANLAVLNKAINEEPLGKIPPPPLGLERKQGHEAQIWRLADMNRLHNLAKILEDLDFQGATDLPQGFFTGQELRKIRTNLTKAQSGARDLIDNRRLELQEMLTDPTLPVQSVWRKKTLKKDEWAILTDPSRPRRYGDLKLSVTVTDFFRNFIQSQEDHGPQQLAQPPFWPELIQAFHRRVDDILATDGFQFTMREVMDREDLASRAEPAKLVLLPLERSGARVGVDPGVFSGVVQADPYTIKAIHNRYGEFKGPNGSFPKEAEIHECSHEILFYREERNIQPLRYLMNREALKQYRDQPQQDVDGEPLFSPALWESLLDPYQTRKRIVGPLAQKVALVVKNLVIQWQTDPVSGNLVPAGSFLAGLEVSLVGDQLQLRRGQDVLALVFTTHQDLQAALAAALLERRDFLAALADLLRGWQVEPALLNGLAPRWRQMGYTAQEIGNFTNDFRNLGAYLTV